MSIKSLLYSHLHCAQEQTQSINEPLPGKGSVGIHADLTRGQVGALRPRGVWNAL